MKKVRAEALSTSWNTQDVRKKNVLGTQLTKSIRVRCIYIRGRRSKADQMVLDDRYFLIRSLLYSTVYIDSGGGRKKFKVRRRGTTKKGLKGDLQSARLKMRWH